MKRKWSVTSLLVLMALFITVIPVQAKKSYYAERFDVWIDIQENGSAIITETVDFHFEGDPFTFAFREISGDETDGLTFLDASMDGEPMSQGTQAGQVEVKEGDPLKVTWHFSPDVRLDAHLHGPLPGGWCDPQGGGGYTDLARDPRRT